MYLVLSIAVLGIIIHLSSSRKASPETAATDLMLPPPPTITAPPNVLQNPHVPPLKETGTIYTSGMPINVPTQGQDAAYSQVGILTRMNGKETILPLMGRPLIANRDKWQFYTMSDQNNSVKLPVSNNGKSCTGEYGCNNLSNGDTVYLEGYNDTFKVTMYDNNVMRYIPYI
jgi:hypothetical protein